MKRRWWCGQVLFLFLFLLASPRTSLRAEETPETDLPPTPASTETQAATDLFVPTERVSIKINLPAARLDFYVAGQLKKSYPIAIGMAKYPTPIRDYFISHINWNPWWIPPDSDWALEAEKTPPGPGNPLGPVKMMMDNGIRIHGTNSPRSIGRAASHACMRMKNADAVELAWEIQQRYSEKNDPMLLETYKKRRRTPYWVKMGEEVPVAVEYRLVERQGDIFYIHPDRYWRGGLQQELQEALAAHPEVIVDKDFLKKLNKKRAKGGTLEITLLELKELALPPPPPPAIADSPLPPAKI
jgi:hypothetical protein